MIMSEADFGTGAKITRHLMTLLDYAMGKDTISNLNILLTNEGKVNENGGPANVTHYATIFFNSRGLQDSMHVAVLGALKRSLY
jgi:hypothetical protein